MYRGLSKGFLNQRFFFLLAALQFGQFSGTFCLCFSGYLLHEFLFLGILLLAEFATANHSNGPALDWQDRHVSAYASAHPWEDWAETWAHYLHMVDALDTAAAEGMEGHGLKLDFRDDIYSGMTFETLMARWIPLTISLNSLSRSMGHDDFYPFVIPEPAYEKLAFVHRVIHQRAESASVAECDETLNLTP